MTSDKAIKLRDIQTARFVSLLKIIKILDDLEATENDTEHGDGEAARAWVLEQLTDEE